MYRLTLSLTMNNPHPLKGYIYWVSHHKPFPYSLFCSLVERSYFILDTEQYVVHFFKKSSDHKPYKTYALASGILNDDMSMETDVIDEETG